MKTVDDIWIEHSRYMRNLSRRAEKMNREIECIMVDEKQFRDSNIYTGFAATYSSMKTLNETITNYISFMDQELKSKYGDKSRAIKLDKG